MRPEGCKTVVYASLGGIPGWCTQGGVYASLYASLCTMPPCTLLYMCLPVHPEVHPAAVHPEVHPGTLHSGVTGCTSGRPWALF